MPSIFPECPSYLSKTCSKLRKSPTKRCVKNNNSNEISESTSKRRKSLQNVNHKNDFSQPSEHDPKFMFASICDKIDISIPSTWSQQKISSNSITVIQFTQWIIKTNDTKFVTVCSKKIILDENMNISIQAMGKEVNVENFGLKTNVIHTIKELEGVIREVNERRICAGYAEVNAVKNVISSVSYRDKEGYLRHKSCPLFLLVEDENDSHKESNKCKFCARLNHKIVEKHTVERNLIMYTLKIRENLK